ncbi:hypothetical protein KZZ52_11325 [Dactylosporangium sp. AC04546]|nr:hypothetical protein [Dactylosporangium sp. AC04546]WVK85939.1 hypothetical protein KZZ52_11325 [Dactylosporangium sp. AC04546]
MINGEIWLSWQPDLSIDHGQAGAGGAESKGGQWRGLGCPPMLGKFDAVG